MTPEKLSAERLTKLRQRILAGTESMRDSFDLLAHCDALAAENRALREALAKIELAPNYVSLGEVQDWARTALEKTR